MIASISWALPPPSPVVAALTMFTAWTARQVERHMPRAAGFIDVDGARIHYLDEGTGPALLLVRGLCVA